MTIRLPTQLGPQSNKEEKTMKIAIGILTAVGGTCIHVAGILTVISAVRDHRHHKRGR